MSLPNQLNVSAPRYTSYPTAPEWGPFSPALYQESLEALAEDLPLSLYFHIPFCASMCLFCGCSVILNRNPEKHLLEFKTTLFRFSDKIETHERMNFYSFLINYFNFLAMSGVTEALRELFEIYLNVELKIVKFNVELV